MIDVRLLLSTILKKRREMSERQARTLSQRAGLEAQTLPCRRFIVTGKRLFQSCFLNWDESQIRHSAALKGLIDNAEKIMSKS